MKLNFFKDCLIFLKSKNCNRIAKKVLKKIQKKVRSSKFFVGTDWTQ